MRFFQAHFARLEDGRIIVVSMDDYEPNGSPVDVGSGEVTTYCDHINEDLCGCRAVVPPTLAELAAALLDRARQRPQRKAGRVPAGGA